MKKYNLCMIFPLKFFFDNNIEKTIFFYEMNPISVIYSCKTEQKFYSAS